MRRITRNALLILAGMTVIVTWSFGWREGLSVLVGGVLAGVNFVWMLRGADAVLAGMKAKPDAADAGRFLLRLLLLFGALFAMIHFSWVSLWGVVLGLAVFIFSTILEAVLLLVEHWIGKR